MNQPTRALRIAVADDEPDIRLFFREVLAKLGHQVVVVAETGQQLVEACRTAHPDLVITDIKMPDVDGLQAAEAVNRDQPVPVILVTGHHDLDRLERLAADHVMAYLSKPAKVIDLQAAIALAMLRFAHFQELRREASSLRQALEDRKIIERAKGAVMKRLGLDEDEAFRRLQRLASHHNRKLIEIAQQVTNAEDMFRQLDKR